MRPDDTAQQPLDAAHDVIRVEARRFNDLLATDRQDLSGEITPADRERPDLRDVVIRFAVFVQRTQREVAIAEHARQQIVEIVRDAAGKRADRFHLLRLPQLIFTARERALGLATRRDVDANGQPAGTTEPT